MKQKSLWMLAILFACCISFVFSSCSDDEVSPTPPSPEGPTLLPSVEPIDPVQCTAAVEFGDISSLPEELQTALKNRFPNMTANGDADICFCKASDVEKFSAQLLKGTTTIVAMPGNGGAMDNIINLAGGVVPKKTFEGFDRLPDEFTSEDVMRCFKLASDGAVRSKTRRLIQDHLIEKISDSRQTGNKSTFRKTGIMML